MKSRVDFSFMRALHELLNIGKQSKNCKYFKTCAEKKCHFLAGGFKTKIKMKNMNV